MSSNKVKNPHLNDIINLNRIIELKKYKKWEKIQLRNMKIKIIGCKFMVMFSKVAVKLIFRASFIDIMRLALGNKPDAEGLSGLARSFFYAGARTLLVSHWPVESRAATLLTTKTFEAMQVDPSVGRSEALRKSMMSLASNDNYSHPAFWAPFVVVGEGGAQR